MRELLEEIINDPSSAIRGHGYSRLRGEAGTSDAGLSETLGKFESNFGGQRKIWASLQIGNKVIGGERTVTACDPDHIALLVIDQVLSEEKGLAVQVLACRSQRYKFTASGQEVGAELGVDGVIAAVH